jgi:hypothetical protein
MGSLSSKWSRIADDATPHFTSRGTALAEAALPFLIDNENE